MNRKFVLGFGLCLLLFCSFSLFLDLKRAEVVAEVLFIDDFVNLNKWNTVEGDWIVSNRVAEGYQQEGECLAWAGSTLWTNYEVNANLRIIASGDEAVLVVRYTDLGNFYWIGLGCWNHKYSIVRVLDYSHTELMYSGDSTEIEVDRWYNVSVIAFDNNLRLFVDGVKVLETEDDSFPNGAIGLGTYDGTMQAKEFVVQSYPPSPTPTPSPTSTETPMPSESVGPTPTASPVPSESVGPTPTASPDVSAAFPLVETVVVVGVVAVVVVALVVFRVFRKRKKPPALARYPRSS